MAAKKGKGKGRYEKIKLESTAGTGYFYTTRKNRNSMEGKMERRKYDPVACQHVAFKEKPIK